MGRNSTLVKNQAVVSVSAGASAAIKVNATVLSRQKYIIAIIDSLGAFSAADKVNNTVPRRLAAMRTGGRQVVVPTAPACE